MALPIENRQIAYYIFVRFNNSYGIRHFCDEQALNSLHFLNGASVGFLRTLAASRPPRYATTRGPYRRDHSPGGGRILRGMRSLGPTAESASSITLLLGLGESSSGACRTSIGSIVPSIIFSGAPASAASEVSRYSIMASPDGTARDAADESIEEKIIGDGHRHARDQRRAHQFAPVEDIAADEVGRDA